MKKLLYLLILMMFFVASCSKDDDEKDDIKPSKPEEEINPAENYAVEYTFSKEMPMEHSELINKLKEGSSSENNVIDMAQLLNFVVKCGQKFGANENENKKAILFQQVKFSYSTIDHNQKTIKVSGLLTYHLNTKITTFLIENHPTITDDSSRPSNTFSFGSLWATDNRTAVISTDYQGFGASKNSAKLILIKKLRQDNKLI